MIDLNNIYVSTVMSFKERLSKIDLSMLKDCSKEGRNHSKEVIDYSRNALRQIDSLIAQRNYDFSELASALYDFKPYYIQCMNATKNKVHASLMIDICKEVINVCKKLIQSIKETKKEIIESVGLLKQLKNSLLDEEQLEDSINVAHLNGESISVNELKSKLSNNSFVLSIIGNLQKTKNESVEKIEYLDYEIGSLMLLKRIAIKKEKKAYDVKNRYYEIKNLYIKKFKDYYDDYGLAFNKMLYYLKTLNAEQIKIIIRTFKIEMDNDVYDKHHILNWIKAKQLEMRDCYLNENNTN